MKQTNAKAVAGMIVGIIVSLAATYLGWAIAPEMRDALEVIVLFAVTGALSAAGTYFAVQKTSNAPEGGVIVVKPAAPDPVNPANRTAPATQPVRHG